MLFFLAITLSTVHGWVLPSVDKTSSLSSHESAITGGVDGARDRRQLSHLTSLSPPPSPPPPPEFCGEVTTFSFAGAAASDDDPSSSGGWVIANIGSVAGASVSLRVTTSGSVSTHTM